jgi:hypothetical protein
LQRELYVGPLGPLPALLCLPVSAIPSAKNLLIREAKRCY